MAEDARSIRCCGREIEDEEGIEPATEAAAEKTEADRDKSAASVDRFTAKPSGSSSNHASYYGGSSREFQIRERRESA
jgi:hypothetical protein